MLTPQGITVLVTNFVVLIALIVFTIFNIIKMSKNWNLGLFVLSMFFVVYTLFLSAQKTHLLIIQVTSLPMNADVYVFICFLCQTLITVVIWNVWGYFSAGKYKIIPFIVSIIYLVLIVVLLIVLKPYTAILDPVTQLYEMDFVAPINYIHYTSLVIDVIALVYIFIKGILAKDIELKQQQLFASLGLILFIGSLVLRAAGMHIALTISRKTVMVIGAYIMYIAFNPPNFIDNLFKKEKTLETEP